MHLCERYATLCLDSLYYGFYVLCLGIMTAKLMLPFMRAFRDEYVAVRKEACIAAGNLRIQDDDLISELLRLANRDPIWRIKALAIQGRIARVLHVLFLS